MLYIQKVLPSFANAHPFIEFAVRSTDLYKQLDFAGRPGVPSISALYCSGKIVDMPCHELTLQGILRGVEELVYQSGNEKKTYATTPKDPKTLVDQWNPFDADLSFK